MLKINVTDNKVLMKTAITAINAIGVEFGVDDMLSEDIDD